MPFEEPDLGQWSSPPAWAEEMPPMAAGLLLKTNSWADLEQANQVRL
jgi:hypothetical protein